jgi:hypothetical protein
VGGQDFTPPVYGTDGRVVEVRIRSRTTTDQIDVIIQDSAGAAGDGHRRLHQGSGNMIDALGVLMRPRAGI